jgi:DNA-binding NarL/FixJ family response regulator
VREKSKAAVAVAEADPFETSPLPVLPLKPGNVCRILLVDDHPIVRRGVRAILESNPEIEVCCEASSGSEALEHLKPCKPDVIVLDLTMPDMNGLEVTTAVREQSPEIEVLILSMHFSDELARDVLRCGARGYVLKSDADVELLEAVERVRRHQPYFTPKLTMSMAQNFVSGPGEGDADGQAGLPLTERELQVVQQLAEGKSNKEVAALLGVSTRTVESHRNHIMHKMGFTSFSELIRFAVRSNLVEP